MGLSLSSIVKNVWNVFSNRSPTGEYKDRKSVVCSNQ